MPRPKPAGEPKARPKPGRARHVAEYLEAFDIRGIDGLARTPGAELGIVALIVAVVAEEFAYEFEKTRDLAGPPSKQPSLAAIIRRWGARDPSDMSGMLEDVFREMGVDRDSARNWARFEEPPYYPLAESGFYSNVDLRPDAKASPRALWKQYENACAQSHLKPAVSEREFPRLLRKIPLVKKIRAGRAQRPIFLGIGVRQK